jgi:putative FmdB family regulatory protein
MPTYEYACEACGHRFEEFQSIKAKPIVVCPKCKKRKVKRLISSGAGFIFKGSGFYETDYRSESYKAAAKKESGGGKTETKTDGAKTEAAPAKAQASKSESKPAASKTEAKATGSGGKE